MTGPGWASVGGELWRARASGQLARVGEALREGHADAGAERGREPGDEGVAGVVRRERDREDRCERRERAVDEADHRRLHLLEEERMVVGHELECINPCAS